MANFSSGATINWLNLPLGASVTSLAAAMAGGYAKTTAGRYAWKALLGQPASLQLNCNQEGVNSLNTDWTTVRIGILGNEQNDCLTPDSAIGFGIQTDLGVPNLSAGDFAAPGAPDSGVLPGAPPLIPKFGYILGAP